MNIFHDNDVFSEIVNGDAEIIPLISEDDEDKVFSEEVPEKLPVLPLRNTVLFPGVVIPITVGRKKSIKLIKDYYKGDKKIAVVSQKNHEIEEPDFEDLHKVGTLATIIRILQMPDDSTTVIIHGKRRIAIEKLIQKEPYFVAQVKPYDQPLPKNAGEKFNALIASLKDMANQIIKLTPNLHNDASFVIKNIESPVFLVNFISSNLNISVYEKQLLLEINDLTKRANKVLEFMTKELQMLELKNQIQSKVKTDMDKQQRDYMLNMQLKTIQEELGYGPGELEINELQEKAHKKKWSKDVAETFEKEMLKLQRINPSAAEYSVHLNYLETLVELPWNDYTKDNFDLDYAQKVLDEDHFGLEKIKERIIEHLAVYKLKGDMKSPILCLVGPPGVGKTSLGKSIGRALSRKYVRMSLGGLRDEAELRGHRKTYIGAMPGRIIQNIKKAKSSNPVFVLDEIDKVSGNNVQGDPQAALLEILDPEQNVSFHDNFLEIEYDLSRIMFIATANSLNTIHPALRDRMEVIDISGYLMQEKIEIAQRHLLPRQYQAHGVKKNQLSFTKKIIQQLIEDYTRESGVRTLEKNIAKVIRSKARYIAGGKNYTKKIEAEYIRKIMGPPLFHNDHNISNDKAGVVTGLAWTVYGGDILFVEVSLSKGKGNLKLTGNLGDVMKESASIAFEYLKANAESLNIDPLVFEKWNVHIHVPEGATPKDGPSAGITMFTALASAFTRRKVRAKLAMTGEITLRGKVLPVGGIKEKILAAKRSKIKDIIISIENKNEIEEIKEEYVSGLKFHYAEDMLDVVNIALLREKVKHSMKLD